MTVTARDGRSLEVLVAPGDGLPLVWHHGTPSAAVPFAPMLRAAAASGLRLVQVSRAGYGTSERRHGRTVVDVVEDTADVLDAIGTETFVTAGWSGGGPHALACAARLPGRCLAAATLAGVGPWSAEGLDFLAGMGPENLHEFGLAAEGEEALIPFLTEVAATLAVVAPEEVAAELGGLVADVDRDSLTGEFAEWTAELFHRSVVSGIGGWADDDLAFCAHWGFELEEVRVPVAVWQGGRDLMVPFAHGVWLASRVPGAEPNLFAEHGHLSLCVGHLEEIFAGLADAARPA